MSEKWEVVGKSKKDKQSVKSKKLSKDEKKKFVDNAPKVEDLLPLAQVKSLYSALDTNKEPVKPVEKATKTKENEAKKAQKKIKEKKESNSVKENNKPPKTIEAAVALISTSDVESVLEVGRLRFADAPLVWLKGLASWLNTKLPVDHTDNVFTAKSWEYPLCLLSADTRAVLKKALKEVPLPAVHMFYDYLLTSMANDMTKGSPVTGYKMLLQLVASQQPSVGVSDLGKAAGIRHSYQNRPAIGCSVMWALGQAGFKDLPTGLQVFQSVMFPVVDLRHYNQFVCDYLKHLLARHSTSKAVTAHHYLEILDAVSKSNNSQLAAHLHTLQGIVRNCQPANRLNNLFEPLLSRLGTATLPVVNHEVLDFLSGCLTDDSQSYAVWRQLYTKYLPQSATLLRYISSKTNEPSSRQLRDTVKTFKVTNDELSKVKPRPEGLLDCCKLCDGILNKMEEGKTFPWRTLCSLIIVVLAGVLAFDVNKHGSFEGSKTGVFLKDVGALKYGQQASVRVQDAWNQSLRWSEQHVPQYWAQVKPYVSSTLELLTSLALQVAASVKLLAQYCVDKWPLVQQWVNQYTPGLQESVSLGLSQAWQYGLQAGSLALKYLTISAEWLQKNVFVGSLSPENLQRLAGSALNTTQAAAAQALSWFK